MTSGAQVGALDVLQLGLIEATRLPPYERYGWLSVGDLDGCFPSLLHAESRYPSLKLCLDGLMLLGWTLCRLCHHVP